MAHRSRGTAASKAISPARCEDKKQEWVDNTPESISPPRSSRGCEVVPYSPVVPRLLPPQTHFCCVPKRPYIFPFPGLHSRSCLSIQGPKPIASLFCSTDFSSPHFQRPISRQSPGSGLFQLFPSRLHIRKYPTVAISSALSTCPTLVWRDNSVRTSLSCLPLSLRGKRSQEATAFNASCSKGLRV